MDSRKSEQDIVAERLLMRNAKVHLQPFWKQIVQSFAIACELPESYTD